MAQGEQDLSAEDTNILQHASDLLHLFHHRNKNQHRHSLWWRAFSIFRRQVSALLADALAINAPPPKTNLGRTRKKVQDTKRRTRIAQRLAFWQDVLLGKWHHAFSQLVADGRFAVLGVVLMSILAELCALLGITTELELVAQAEVEKVLEEFGKEEWGLDSTTVLSPAARSGEDLGEVVTREAVVEKVDLLPKSDDGIARTSARLSTENMDAPVVQKHRLPSGKAQRKTKKRKTGNAIDDLFGDLG